MIIEFCLLRNIAIINISISWQHFLPMMISISYCTFQVLSRDYFFSIIVFPSPSW